MAEMEATGDDVRLIITSAVRLNSTLFLVSSGFCPLWIRTANQSSSFSGDKSSSFMTVCTDGSMRKQRLLPVVRPNFVL